MKSTTPSSPRPSETRNVSPRIQHWLEASGGLQLKNTSESYQEFHERGPGDERCMEQIQKELPRTQLLDLPIDFAALERVLVALSNFVPEKKDGYIQGWDQMAAFLLHQTTEDFAFWIMAGLVTKFLPKGYFDMLLIERGNSMMTRLEKQDTQLHGRFDEYCGCALCLKWFGTLFVNTLSFKVTAEIWDVMFDTGDPAFLEEVGANLLMELKPLLMAAQDNDFRNVLTDAPLELDDVGSLYSIDPGCICIGCLRLF